WPLGVILVVEIYEVLGVLPAALAEMLRKLGYHGGVAILILLAECLFHWRCCERMLRHDVEKLFFGLGDRIVVEAIALLQISWPVLEKRQIHRLNGNRRARQIRERAAIQQR